MGGMENRRMVSEKHCLKLLIICGSILNANQGGFNGEDQVTKAISLLRKNSRGNGLRLGSKSHY